MSYVRIGSITKAWEEGVTLGRRRYPIPADRREHWRRRGRQLEETFVAGHEFGTGLKPLPIEQVEMSGIEILEGIAAAHLRELKRGRPDFGGVEVRVDSVAVPDQADLFEERKP